MKTSLLGWTLIATGLSLSLANLFSVALDVSSTTSGIIMWAGIMIAGKTYHDSRSSKTEDHTSVHDYLPQE